MIHNRFDILQAPNWDDARAYVKHGLSEPGHPLQAGPRRFEQFMPATTFIKSYAICHKRTSSGDWPDTTLTSP
jgi:hypothetical protein